MKENPMEVPDSIPELLEALHLEDGVTPAERVKSLFTKRDHIMSLVVNDLGKFRVLGVDRYDNEDWVAGEFESADKALRFAEKRTSKAKPLATDESIATVYYAYSPDGNYLGGNTWTKPSKPK